MDSIIINELLCFVSTQYDKLTRQNLNSIVLEYYSKDDLVTAKQILVNICEKIGLSNNISEFKIKRIGANVEQKLVKDLLDIWDEIDAVKGGNTGTTFVAADPNRLPSVDADKFNLQFLVSIVLKIQEENQSLKSQLETVVSSVTELHKKLPQQNDIPLSASPFLHTPPFASPRRQLPIPKEGTLPAADNEGESRRLDANTPSFVPRQECDAERAAASAAATFSVDASNNLSLAPFLLKNRANNSNKKRSSSAVAATSVSPGASSSTTKASRVTSPLVPVSPASSSLTPSKASAAPATPAVASATPAVAPATAAAAPATPAATASATAIPPVATTPLTPKWNLVVARNKKKIVPVTGQVVKSSDDDLEGVPPVIRDYWDLSVSRLKETATADKVKTHLHKYGIEVKDVFILSSKIRGTKSAKVRVAREHRERAKSPDIWPQHCRVADWVHFKKSERPVTTTGPL